MSNTDLLTTRQVARRLNCSRAKIIWAVKHEKLIPVMQLPGINGAFLFTHEAVIAWTHPGSKLFTL